MIKNILFDLDGTLLPMDMDVFTGGYFKLLVKKLAPFGFEAQELIKNIWAGTKCMVLNDGSRKNIDVFWEYMGNTYGEKAAIAREKCDAFYGNEFEGGREFCGYNPKAKELVMDLKAEGYRLILATNPIFPDVATRKRTNWTGLDVSDFEGYTTYENSSFSKPNPKYYSELIDRFSLISEECLMIGNDVDEDMVAQTLGMQVYLLTDCMINKNNKDISVYDHGNFDDLRSFLGI